MRTIRTAGVLEHQSASVRTKLAAAWTSFMFLYVYVDILGLYKPAFVDDILAGVVWNLTITQTWAVGALTLMTIPIAIHLLDRRLCRCDDIAAAPPPPHSDVEVAG